MEHDYFFAVKIDGYFSVPNAPNETNYMVR